MEFLGLPRLPTGLPVTTTTKTIKNGIDKRSKEPRRKNVAASVSHRRLSIAAISTECSLSALLEVSPPS